MKVLIVDDRRENLELLCAVLEADGHQVVQAGDGFEALQLLERGGVNAVITDILMPKMDGYRLCFEIRRSERWRNLPVIIYTATYTSPSDERLSLDLGADAYLRKPASAKDIIEALHAVMRGRRKQPTQPVMALPELEVMKEYNERLVSKLEEKNQELTTRTVDLLQANQALQAEVNERQLAKESLKLFRALVDGSNDAFEIVDPETARFIDVNDKGCTDLGYSREELRTLRVFDIDPTVKESDWAPLMQKLRHQGAMIIERVHERRDGTTFPIEINMKLVRLDREYVVVVVRDITERKLAQEEAVRQQVRFQFIFGSVPVGIAWMVRSDPASRIVNPAFAQITGVPVGQSYKADDYRKATHPADWRRQDELHRRLLAGEIETYTMEKRYVHPDGVIRWAVLTVRNFYVPNSGEVQEISTVVDITARKLAETALRESEERFREIAENIHEVFWITNPAKNQILYVSPAYEKIWGRDCASLYAHPPQWAEAINEKDRARVLAAAATKQATGEYDEIYCINRPDGSQRWIHDRAFPIRDAAGQVRRVVGIAEDITQHRKLEEQFRQAQKMEAIGTLAGGIAHDFNNILAAVNGYAELCKMKAGENSPLHEYLEAISHAGARATSLVRQILTFSRQQEQQRQSVCLCDIVDESLKLLRATIPTTIEFAVTKAPDVPTVLADPTQIHQVLMNLGTNAWHAMRNHTGRLTVKVENFEVDQHFAETRPRLRPGPYVRISVADTGCGMDEATLSRMFEPFFTTKSKGEGTGLGLAVIHGIMESHDGLVTVYSKPGEGTIFHLYFPAQEGQALPETIPPGPTPQGQGKRILYVDDEEPLAKLGKKTLEQLGYQVEVSTKVTEALEWVRLEPARFDLVITDQTMPGMTGMDFAAQLLKIRPDLPIILTTGYSAYLTTEHVHSLGIRDLLLKPHTLHTLGIAVHHALVPKKPE